MFRGRLAPARALRLVGQLPEGGAFWAAWIKSHPVKPGANPVTEVGWRGWTVDRFQRATIINLLAAANWQRAGDANAPRPKPVPVPTTGPVVKRMTMRDRMRSATSGGG